MEGEYPAAENPVRNLPAKIMERFCEVAIRIQPIRSGAAIIRIAFRRPNLGNVTMKVVSGLCGVA
jgi:hypothetical protein